MRTNELFPWNNCLISSRFQTSRTPDRSNFWFKNTLSRGWEAILFDSFWRLHATKLAINHSPQYTALFLSLYLPFTLLSLLEFSSNSNPKWTVIVFCFFSNFSRVVWTESNWCVFRVPGGVLTCVEGAWVFRLTNINTLTVLVVEGDDFTDFIFKGVFQYR